MLVFFLILKKFRYFQNPERGVCVEAPAPVYLKQCLKLYLKLNYQPRVSMEETHIQKHVMFGEFISKDNHTFATLCRAACLFNDLFKLPHQARMKYRPRGKQTASHYSPGSSFVITQLRERM